MKLNAKLILVISLTAFAFIWSFIAIPSFMQSEWFRTLIPPIQYFLFNIGFIIGFITLVGLPITYILTKEFNAIKATQIGISSWLGVSLIFDLLQPPYYVGLDGTPILYVPEALTGTAVDAMVLWLWQHIISGPPLFYCVYFVTPIIVIICMALILNHKQFLNLIKRL